MYDFYCQVFNAVPRVFESEGGWHGDLRYTLPEVDINHPTLPQQIEAHRIILGLLGNPPAREA